MAALLTWKVNGPAASNTGATVAGLLTDIKALVDGKSADPTYPWEVSHSNLGGSPWSITLRRKSLAAGRVLLWGYSGVPAGTNPNVFSQSPTGSVVYGAWFPNGNTEAPSNLSAASGTILGNDTGCSMAVWCGSPGTIYTANYRVATFETAETWGFVTQLNTGASVVYGGHFGKIAVDANDTEWDGAIGGGNQLNFAVSASNPFQWTGSPVLPGQSSSSSLRITQGNSGNSRQMYVAWVPSGTWNGTAFGASSDPTVDSTNARCYFFPCMLMGNSIGAKDGIPLKLRQMALGPTSISQFGVMNSSGPTKQATALWPFATSSATTTMWMTEFRP